MLSFVCPLFSPLDVKNNDVVPWVLSSILSKYITSQNPHVRQAACIWLLSLVKKLSQHKEITVSGCVQRHTSESRSKGGTLNSCMGLEKSFNL